MRFFASVILCALLSLTTAAQAQSKPPLFEAFLKFCADPNMMPGSISAAVESAGGKIYIQDKADFPFHLTTSSWHAMVQGQKFDINAADSHIPIHSNMMQELVTCTISDLGHDDGTKAALKQWVTVAPDGYGQEDGSGLKRTTYHFEWDGQKRVPAPDGNVSQADEEAGKVWRLEFTGMGPFSRVRLERSLKATPKQ